MDIELQFSTQLFASIVGNRIRALDLCVDASAGGQVVDRIVPRSTTVQKETRLDNASVVRTEVASATATVWVFSPQNYTSFVTRHLQLVQELDVYLVDEADLAANGISPTAAAPTTLKAAFNVKLTANRQTQGGGPATLSYTLAWVHFGLIDPFLPPAQRAQLEALLAAVQLPSNDLDLSALAGVTGTALTAINAGITLSADKKAVCLRIDVDVVKTPPRVSAEFFSGGAPNLLGGQDWAVLVDKDLLIDVALDKVGNGLTGQAGTRKRWGPQAHWEPEGPRLVLQAGIEVLGACPFFIDDIDLDVDIEVASLFALKSPTQLALRFHVHGEAADTAEIIGCAVVPALFWPIAGPLILDKLKAESPVGAYFMGLLTGLPAIAMMFASAVGTMTAASVKASQFGANCEKQGDSDVECIYPFRPQLGDPAFPIRLQAQVIRGTPHGLVLAGPAQLKVVAEETITVTTTPLQWTVIGGCRTGFRFAVQAQAKVSSTGLRGGVCSARIVDDPLGEFTVLADRASNLVTIGIRGSASYAALADKYPCRVRIVTTGGVRTLTYPPPAPMTADEQRHLEAFKHNFERVCQAWRDSFVEIEWGGWKPVGPTDGPDWQQHWELAIHELLPGEWIDVTTDRGERVLSAKASANGVLHFAAVFDGPKGPASLRATRRQMDPAGRSPVVTLLQMVLVHRRTLPLDRAVQSVRFEGMRAAQRLVLSDGVTTHRFALGGREVGAALSLTAHDGPAAATGAAPAPAVPRVAGNSGPLFLAGRDHFCALYRHGPADEQELVQEYLQPARFRHCALGGSWVARWDGNGREVRIYQIVARRSDAEVPRRFT